MTHRTRSITYLGTDSRDRRKHYGIATHAEDPRRALATATREAAADLVPDGAYSFTIAHDAQASALGLVYWWAHENELLHRVLVAPHGDPAALVIHDGPEMACVWELEVVDFERRAWLRHVLQAGDRHAYLSSTLEPVHV